MNNTAGNIHVNVLCVRVFSFLLGVHPGVELLGHVVDRGATRLFLSGCTTLHPHQQCRKVPVSLHPPSTNHLTLILAIRVGPSEVVSVVLI